MISNSSFMMQIPPGHLQIVAVSRFATCFLLYKRRKALRMRQSKVAERAMLKLRMKKAKGKRSTMGATALKRFRRVSGGRGSL